MKYIIITLILLVSFFHVTYSQESECATDPIPLDSLEKLPWFYNRDYLNRLEDSLFAVRENKISNYIENVNFRVPIQFFIYTLENGSPGGNNPILPTAIHIQRLLDEINNSFRNNNVSIRYYLSNISYKEKSKVRFTMTECHHLAKTNINPLAYNVHIVDDIEDAGGLRVYGPYYRAVFIERRTYINFDNLHIFSHETGHYFGLDHTFKNTEDQVNCKREPVTRQAKFTLCPPFPGAFSKRCLYTGDLICDTPADPNMMDNGSINPTTLNWECDPGALCHDQYDLAFEPNIYNYMAYGNAEFREDFTSGQVQWMHGFANLMHPQNFEDNYFDIYEPDDFPETAREIQANEIQFHTFHARNLIPNNKIPDTDYLSFTIDNTNIDAVYRISVEPLPDVPKVNLGIRVSDPSGNIIVDTETQNYYASADLIPAQFGDYLIELYSLETNPLLVDYGYYGVSVTECVLSENCSSDYVSAGTSRNYAAVNSLVFPCNSAVGYIVESYADVTAKSMNSIELLPGFDAWEGSDFTAEIVENLDCGSNNMKAGLIVNYPKPVLPNYVDYSCEAQTDNDKSVIQPVSEELSVEIYPNPASDYVILSSTNPDPEAEIFRLYNSYGSCVSSGRIELIQQQIDISKLPSGFYYFSIETAHGIAVKKLIIQ